jgi:hypothetical protein
MIRGIADYRARPLSGAAKAAGLLRLLAFNPVEFYDRVRAKVEIKAGQQWPTFTRYEPVSWESFTEQLKDLLPTDVSWRRDNGDFLRTHRQLRERAQSLGSIPFPAIFDGDPLLARLAYMFTRALEPEVVVETGVALGVVSSCILSALERNGRGRLISIDLPPLGVSADSVGQIIPDDLRSRWKLMRGTSTRVLRTVLADLPPVGLFVQDSLFTWRNSTQEYSQVLPHLARQSAIVANCVQHSHAFAWLVEQSRPSIHAVLAAEEKADELIGVCLYRRDR